MFRLHEARHSRRANENSKRVARVVPSSRIVEVKSVMERRISPVEWGSLPGNVIDNILLHVPSAHVPALRLMCRHWRRQVDLSIRNLATNGKFPGMMPLWKIPMLFPTISHLDLSSQEWGYGQSLTPAYCAQLSCLDRLHRLQSLKLVNWSTLPLAGFKVIVGLEHLTELDVTNCDCMTDSYLSLFHSVQSSLKILILDGCARITDNGIAHLSSLLHLTELKCDLIDHLSSMVMRRLAHVLGVRGETLCQLSSTLESLDVSFCKKLKDEAVKSLINCSSSGMKLRSLNLSGCPNVKSTTLASIVSLTHMTRLKLNCLPQLVEMDQWNRLLELQVLEISRSKGLDMEAALPVIAQMTQLRCLRMNHCQGTQRLQSRMLSGLKHLRCLEMTKWSNIQFGLEAADVLPNLEVLNLAECYGRINNSQEFFTKCQKLKILGLSKIAYLPHKVLVGVGRLRSLEVLNLSGLGNMTNRTVQEIAKAMHLKYLDLSQNGLFCKVTNKGILYLRSLKMLKSLKISGWTEVTPEGFSVLKSLSSLASLDVSSCTNVDNKVVRMIAYSMPMLTELNLVNCFQVACSELSVLRMNPELATLKLPLHLKGDIQSELPNLKNLELVSPLDGASWEDPQLPTNFQHVLEHYTREEDIRGCVCLLPHPI